MSDAAGWAIAGLATGWAVRSSRRAARQGARVARAEHELRGPLGTIRLGLELGLRQGTLTRARLRALELECGRAALALEELGGAPGAGGAPECVWLGPLLADAVEAWQPAAVRRGVALRLAPSGPVAVWGSRERLGQALGNLIANALEHGDGSVVVGLRPMPAAVVVEVCDAGAGLARPLAELLGGREPVGRHGHGLRVAAAVARAHGGRLVSAPVLSGARIGLELPRAEISSARSSA